MPSGERAPRPPCSRRAVVLTHEEAWTSGPAAEALERLRELRGHVGGRPRVVIVANEQYAFGVGPTAWPEIALTAGPFEAGGSARLDWLRSVDALDREQTSAPRVDTEERRVGMRGWLAVTPAPHVRLEASAERRQRDGRVGDVTASRGETSLFGSVGVVF